MNVTEPIRHRAATWPDAAALVRADGSVLGARALDRAIDATAQQLIAAGFTQARPALLRMGGPDEAVGLVAAMALARLGIASAAPGWTAARPGAEEAVRFPTEEAAVAAAPMWADASVPFRIFATSGTTGTPKHFVASQAMMAQRVMSYWLAFGPHQDTHMCGLSLGIIPGCTAVLRCWWGGGTLVLGNPAEAGVLLRRHAVQSLLLAPASLADVLAHLPPGWERPSSMRVIEVTGSALGPALAAEARARLCPEIVSLYGASEVGAIAIRRVRADGAGRDVGWVAPGVRVDALGPDGEVLARGQDGLLRVQSAGMVERYLDDPEQTAACFRQGGFVSGDLGSVSAAGVVRVIGRANDVINAGGVKISPAVIEDVLLAVVGVREAAAFAVPRTDGTVEPWAAVVGGAPIPQEVLRAACEPLGPMAPRRVFQIPALPRNANGKVLRDALAREAAAEAARRGGGG